MRSYDDPCGVARALAAVGERWSLLVVRELLLGPKRFAELGRGLPGMSPNVLSQRLRDLQAAGVLTHRDLGPPVSAGVYELTEWGRQLEPVLLALGRWGARAPMRGTAPLGVDALMLALRTTYVPDGGAPAVVRLRLGVDAFTVATTGQDLRVTRGDVEAPDAGVDTDTATLREVVFRRRALADAVAAGAIVLTGDRDTAARLLGSFRRPEPADAGPPEPGTARAGASAG
ncbi:winged helix-turn-helix transcriptional regulator [Micromonospora coxensis]|uniref:Transcriptional regulator, HxlR family n=1 Tax=Micromonospora coxensis TaxID=356852 RepID=A0A1C5GN09_9ACTN|nr:helix-turn-helix domain-containing protein [Micromonospora coxensis]SCG35176.1 transcriptional regulator, HxlR family [Micromonospora coxensis]